MIYRDVLFFIDKKKKIYMYIKIYFYVFLKVYFYWGKCCGI